MNSRTAFLLLIFLMAGCTRQRQSHEEVQMTPPGPAVEAEAELWIDVRTLQEYEAGHLEGAINIPHQEIGSRIAEVAPDRNQPVKLYCRSGRRSGIAEKTLSELGYTNLSNEGGYEAIKKRRSENK